MTSDRIKGLIYGATAYGLEVNFRSGDSFDYTLIKTTIKKSQLEIVEKTEGSGKEGLKKVNWEKKVPLSLLVRGKGVLQKKVEAPEEDSKLIWKVLPNASPDDFYIQTTAIDAIERWVTIVRKNQLDELTRELQDMGLHIVNLSLGWTVLGEVAHLLNRSEFDIEDQRIKLDAGVFLAQTRISDDSEKRNLVKLGDEEIESVYLPAFAASMKFHKQETDTSVHEKIKGWRKEFKQHRIFLSGVRASLAFFLLLLLINFMVFQHYNTEYANLSGKLSINTSLLQKLKGLKEEQDRNRLFFESTDLISSSHNSYYSDRLAASKPKGIFWNELSLNPSVKAIKKSEDIGFDLGKINIKGVSTSSELLNGWILDLEQEEWIQSIDIKQYQRQEKGRDANFFIQIQTK